jgi:hypothetical protein
MKVDPEQNGAKRALRGRLSRPKPPPKDDVSGEPKSSSHMLSVLRVNQIVAAIVREVGGEMLVKRVPQCMPS